MREGKAGRKGSRAVTVGGRGETRATTPRPEPRGERARVEGVRGRAKRTTYLGLRTHGSTRRTDGISLERER